LLVKTNVPLLETQFGFVCTSLEKVFMPKKPHLSQQFGLLRHVFGFKDYYSEIRNFALAWACCCAGECRERV